VGPHTDLVEAGGLIAYAVNYPDLYFRFAALADKIFKGAKPGELPVEQPTKFKLVINLKTAKALGLDIAPSLLEHRTRSWIHRVLRLSNLGAISKPLVVRLHKGPML
jgi:ABC-type uncharacterized transport system substrate-binding protein